MNRAFVLTGLLCISLATSAGPACGDDSEASIPIESVEDAYLDFYCQTVLDCDMGWAPLMESVAECREFMEGFERGVVAIGQVVDAVNQGNAAYSPTDAARCLSDLQALGCEVFGSPDPESCGDVFEGFGADGDSCRLNDECESGWCDTRQSCPGLCAQPVADGGSCADDQQCDFGLVCFDDVCEPHPGPLAAGQHCDPDLSLCGYGHYCDEQTEVCTALRQGGDDCDADSSVEECGPGMACIGNTCVTLQLVEAQSDACDPLTGLICNPLAGLGCVMDFTDIQNPVGTTCQPFGQLGDDCVDVQNRLYTPCDELHGVWCNRQNQVCESQKAGGQPCMQNEECLSGSCEGTPGECAVEPCWRQ